MVGHDQPKRRIKGAELFQSLRAETLDCGDQGGCILGCIGHAKSSALLELEESSFRFVRHSVRWYRWASLYPGPNVPGWRATLLFFPGRRFRAIGRMMRLWDFG
jgi:hypothetical protein